MDHQNTIPSVLGPMSGPQAFSAHDAKERGAEGGGLLKLVFWAALGLLALAVVRHFLR